MLHTPHWLPGHNLTLNLYEKLSGRQTIELWFLSVSYHCPCIWRGGKKKAKKKKAAAWYHNVTFKFYTEKALSGAYSESFFSQFFFLEMWWCEDRQNWEKKQSKSHLPHSIITNHPRYRRKTTHTQHASKKENDVTKPWS